MYEHKNGWAGLYILQYSVNIMLFIFHFGKKEQAPALFHGFCFPESN